MASARDGYRTEINSFLVRQPEGEPIPRRIEWLTGITNEHMDESVEAEEVYRALSKTIRGYRSIDRGLAHYAKFEKPFLIELAKKHGGVESFPIPLLCTCEIAKRIFPNVPSRGIRAMAGFLGNPLSDMKRSACHVSATFLIWKDIEKQLREIGLTTLEEVEEWLRTSKIPKRQRYDFFMDRIKRLSMPDRPGLYRMLDCNGRILYVGKATSLRSRVNSYFRGKKGRDAKKLEMLAQVVNVGYTECETALEAAIVECDEIKRLNPPYNIQFKVGGRRVAYFNREFNSASYQKDEEHWIGPFSNENVLMPVIILSRVLTHSPDDLSELNPWITFNRVEDELLAPGFQIFVERLKLDTCMSGSLQNPRSLLALGLRLHRKEVREARALRDAEEASRLSNVECVSALGAVDEIPEGEHLEKEISAEDVANSFEHRLIHCARAYLLSKAITTLMNCNVSFKDGGIEGSLKVRDGNIEFERKMPELPELESQSIYDLRSPITGDSKDLASYDRVRVLFTELSRIRAEGGNVELKPLLCEPAICAPRALVMNCEA